MPPDAGDAARDALALVRAYLAGDAEGACAVSGNLAWPAETVEFLAEWLAGALRQMVPEPALFLDAWQRRLDLL